MRAIKLKPSRLAPGLGERLEPRPAMAPEAGAFLASRLTDCACYLEYGGGGSTLLAAQTGVPNIYAVESDRLFADELRRRLRRDGHAAQAHVLAIDIGETGRWGYPLTRDRRTAWPDYPLQVWADLARAALSPDLILIDGRFRIACFLASLLQARPGAVILFDDYVERHAHYGRVEEWMKPKRIAGGAGVFMVPAKDDVAHLADRARSALTDAFEDLL